MNLKLNIITKPLNLLNFGDFKRYEKGGLGTVNERINDKIKDVKLMVGLFPKNVKIKDKPNEPKNSHIIIKR